MGRGKFVEFRAVYLMSLTENPQDARSSDSSCALMTFLNLAPGLPVTRASQSGQLTWRANSPFTTLKYE